MVDVSELVNVDARTGIQRVVRSILQHLLSSESIGFKVVPVYFDRETGFMYANRFLDSFTGRESVGGGDKEVEFSKGDVFLGLDFAIHFFPEMNASLVSMKERGVIVSFVLYDLTPILNHACHTPELVEMYRVWLNSVCSVSDVIACISKSVENDLNSWLTSAKCDDSDLRVTSFHLGADIENSSPTRGLPEDCDESIKAFSGSAISCLMVGTMEPRKGYRFVLDGFDQLWAGGADISLVIVGRSGWGMESFQERLLVHPEFGKRLHWLNGVSDEYLSLIYGASDVLIAASEAEGFGLPLIEAAVHGLPVIARDIPVFREVGGGAAFYFSGEDPAAFCQEIHQWIDEFKNGSHPNSSEMTWLTWAQSSQALVEAIGLPKS
ncbi:MAG: glycosyltransferase family 1 protein [Verrucomicrobiales bacterium]|nr:glycosyltransferase family 1 protein [Verrucomicrobiales bacterium]